MLIFRLVSTGQVDTCHIGNPYICKSVCAICQTHWVHQTLAQFSSFQVFQDLLECHRLSVRIVSPQDKFTKPFPLSPMVNMDMVDMDVVDMDVVDMDGMCLFQRNHTILQRIPSPNEPDSRALGLVILLITCYLRGGFHKWVRHTRCTWSSFFLLRK